MLPFFIGAWLCITPIQFVGDSTVHIYDINHHVMVCEFSTTLPNPLIEDFKIITKDGKNVPIFEIKKVEEIDSIRPINTELWALLIPRLEYKETYYVTYKQNYTVTYFFNGYAPNLISNPMK